MTVRIAPFKGRKDEWEVDIRFQWPDGTRYRERKLAPTSSKSGAKKWGEQRERELFMRGRPNNDEVKKKETPTLQAFWPRFLEEHCQAERLKPSTIQGYRQVFNTYLLPRLGNTKLDAIKNADIQKLKGELSDKKPSTVNNILTCLSVCLKKAVEWGVLEVMPCTVRLLRVMHDERAFHDFEEYEQLVEGAARVDPRAELIVLLGGDAGLRLGEVTALEWCRVNFRRNVLVVAKAEWRGQVDTPKGRRIREVPMTKRLANALKAHRHLKGERVLYLDNGNAFTREIVRKWIMKVERRAGLPVTGRIHILRHTFCAHLAMRGAPAKAIQELAGHADLTTTMRYMHLSPSARDKAIELLDAGRSPEEEPRTMRTPEPRRVVRLRGELGETAASN